MTNFERIKNMTVDELAILLRSTCPYALEPITDEKRATGRKKCLSNMSCNECRTEWLNSEVGE